MVGLLKNLSRLISRISAPMHISKDFSLRTLTRSSVGMMMMTMRRRRRRRRRRKSSSSRRSRRRKVMRKVMIRRLKRVMGGGIEV